MVGGHSSGAHLAAMLLYDDWAGNETHFNLIKALVLISGVFDLRPIVRISSTNGPLKLDTYEKSFLRSITNLQLFS